MFSDDRKKEIASRIRRFSLGCMVEFRPNGVLTLLHDNPIDVQQVFQAFPHPLFEVLKVGRINVKIDRPELVHSHFFVDIMAN